MRNLMLVSALILLSFPSALAAQVRLSGRVVFQGPAPAAETISVTSDTPTCGTSKTVRKLIPGKDQGVADAVVVLKGAAGTPQPAEGKLDQVNCEFVPHVQVLPVGSTLKLTSSDPVLHNAHGFFEDGTTAFNLAVPIAGMELPVTLRNAGVIKLRCDAGHTWMSAYVVVSDQAYSAVTDSDGNFTLEALPAGTYDLEVWHEWLLSSRQPVSVSDPPAAPVLVTLKAPPSG